MPDSNIEILRKETYLKAIENSVDSKIFSSLFVRSKDTKEVKDILNDGEYSCAFFVSSILYLSQAVNRTCSTVRSLRDMFESDNKWQVVAVEELEPGDVLVWERITFEDGSEAPHVGFALNKQEAVSTNYKKKAIDRHPIISDSGRKVEVAYRYSWDQ